MKPFSSLKINSINISLHSQNQALNHITDLYNRYEGEPDFDCEFLKTDGLDTYENETILDPEPEEYADDYNDREWDNELYDPYQEQTYY